MHVNLDFSADPNAVSTVAEAHRLAYGHLFNPSFATETSRIDPLPHQRIAVYEHMLQQSPLRFLLADDAGAGKTIMTGLYVREMLSRQLIRRVLIVPPAGLLGNWKSEMWNLFRLQFRIISGSDTLSGNPFLGPESELLIVSIDTLAGDRLFGQLKDPRTDAYDLVVFDEAHKLSANRQPDFRVRKTGRYKLAEAIAGGEADSEQWALPWSARHLLLLTATPHMGKDHPYYFLWRLLLPDTLATYDAFVKFSAESRRKHFIRRTKEEMVHFDGSPLYPRRTCNTLSYQLTQGPENEQELYDETTDYIRNYYNRAQVLNRSAARLAMSVFQRRLASSTYALMRSFERRRDKLTEFINDIRNERLTEEQLAQQQRRLDNLDDQFETRTADEDAACGDGREQHEDFESSALAGTVALSLAELEKERFRVAELLDKARKLYNAGEESKFERLRDVLQNPEYADQKFIIFTEHRDTANFLVRRLESLGFTGQVSLIHGGLPYQERERQVEFFRKPMDEGGANYLVATDAAGEGINLQFCWLMVNYDIPWNPARLEQRMGRIHRYGQKHDPVIIINLVAGSTREGRVLKTLLDKLEAIRQQLQSDKVFDVIGRLFQDLSISDYLEQALMEEDPSAAAERLQRDCTQKQVRALEEKERALFGEGGDVRRKLASLNDQTEQESYRRLLPGYVRRFLEKAAPLLDLRIEGNPEATFSLFPQRPRALDPLLPAFEMYPESARGRLRVSKPRNDEEAIWMHPGEPLFDIISSLILSRFAHEGLKGAVFIDPYAGEPYLFHLALVSVERSHGQDNAESIDLLNNSVNNETGARVSNRSTEIYRGKWVDSRLVGLRQREDGTVEECPVEHLLLLRGARDFAPGRVPLAHQARRLASAAHIFVRDEVVKRMVEFHQQRILDELPARMEHVSRGFDHQAAELAQVRVRFSEKARTGDRKAVEELSGIKERQRSLNAARTRRLNELKSEPHLIQPGEVEFLAHTLVVPAQEHEEIERYDADVEVIAMKVAVAYEERFGAEVKDVSRLELARRAGLTAWPGFDLLSRRPASSHDPVEGSCQGDSKISWTHFRLVDPNERCAERAIEVKGRAGTGNIEMSENEWTRACNLRDRYWLYVVFDCATPSPRLVRVRDPFARLIARSRESLAFTFTPKSLLEIAE